MKRKAILSFSLVFPIAALALGAALAQPPKAMASGIGAPALVARPDWNLHIVSPLTVTVSDRNALTGMRSVKPADAAVQLDG